MNARAPAMIEVAALEKRFGSQRAVAGLGFVVRAGEIFGIVGPDGAGKTTTLRMLAGVMRPDAGSIAIDGVDVLAAPERAKRHVSYMPQRFGLYEDLSVDENIRFFAELFEMPDRVWRERADSLLRAADMAAFRSRLAGQLSGGMKQKLGLICSLVHRPRVLLLDEPTTGVDPLSRREFWQILYALRAEGVAMLISTAYLDEAERCDRLALLNQGAVMHCDTPRSLQQLLPGAMLELVATDPARALEIVRALPGVLGALRVGVGAHVHVDAPQRQQQIVQALCAQGVAVQALEPVAPTIEDLFVYLLAQQDAPQSAP